MVTIYYKNLQDEKVRVLREPKAGSWIHLEDPTPKELARLAKNFSLSESMLADALDPDEVPRVEHEAGKEYIFTRFAVGRGERVVTLPLLIVHDPDHTFTVSKEPFPLSGQLGGEEVDIITTQKTKFIIQVFLTINNDYQKFVTSISKKIRNLTANIEKITNKDIAQMVSFEAIFNDFLSDLEPTNVTLEKLLSGKSLRLYEEDRELVEDLFVSNNQLIDICRSNLTHIRNTREAYSTIISNNLNKTMKLLTSVTLILTIPTMIASFYGMNVPLPLQDHPLAFVFIVLLTIAIILFLIVIFIKNDFL